MTTEKRKGARSIKEIPESVMELLNSGKTETANLVEWLGTDQKSLVKNVLSQLNKSEYLPAVLEKLAKLPKQTVNTINEGISLSLFESMESKKDQKLLKELSEHTSDLVRGWAAYIIGRYQSADLKVRFDKLVPFAADQHFGVREIAWLAVRPRLIDQLKPSLSILEPWAKDGNENIRRFASELTRPRGVWCHHITALKTDPEMALNILEPLKSDSSKYVQNSVGNWLNDAGKTRPDFVKTTCSRWSKESDTKETAYIIKRGMRNL